jgi:DNA-binding transcriptional LysR family regulator
LAQGRRFPFVEQLWFNIEHCFIYGGSYMHHQSEDTMNWDDLKIFLAVAEAPSMRIAARKLCVSHSTVSRRIDGLEERLAARLFSRTADGYVLTRAGEELLPVATAMEEKLYGFERQVAGRDEMLEGEVCVTVPDAVVVTYLMPFFIEFMEKYPAIRLKVADSFELFDLSRREADVAIRFTNSPPDHLIGRQLGTLYQAVYATREYLARHDPRAPGSGARWVGWGQPTDHPAWTEQTPFPDLPVACHFDNVLLQLEAVRLGAGLGYLPCVMADGDESLVRISEPGGPAYGAWMLSHRDLRAAARMRVFRQFIASRIPQISAAFAGSISPATR